MRRALLVLCLLLPLAACGTDRFTVEVREYPDEPAPTTCVVLEVVPSTPTARPSVDVDECLRRQTEPDLDQQCPDGKPFGSDPGDVQGQSAASAAECAALTPAPSFSVPPAAPPEPADTLASASALLSASGGEVTLVKGLSPHEALVRLVPGARPRPMTELCDSYGVPRTGGAAGQVRGCLTARTVQGWTLVYGGNDLTVGLGAEDLLARLSDGGREVVHVADHFEADAPFVVARDGREVRRFDFCSEGSADEGTPLPQETGLVVDSCEFERFVLVQRLTGVSVTADLLTTGDRVAVATTF